VRWYIPLSCSGCSPRPVTRADVFRKTKAARDALAAAPTTTGRRTAPSTPPAYYDSPTHVAGRHRGSGLDPEQHPRALERRHQSGDRNRCGRARFPKVLHRPRVLRRQVAEGASVRPADLVRGSSRAPTRSERRAAGSAISPIPRRLGVGHGRTVRAWAASSVHGASGNAVAVGGFSSAAPASCGSLFNGTFFSQ